MACPIVGKYDAEGTSRSTYSGKYNPQASSVYSTRMSERVGRKESGVATFEATGVAVPGAAEKTRGLARKSHSFSTIYSILHFGGTSACFSSRECGLWTMLFGMKMLIRIGAFSLTSLVIWINPCFFYSPFMIKICQLLLSKFL
jgi:hypothetical protein